MLVLNSHFRLIKGSIPAGAKQTASNTFLGHANDADWKAALVGIGANEPIAIQTVPGPKRGKQSTWYANA